MPKNKEEKQIIKFEKWFKLLRWLVKVPLKPFIRFKKHGHTQPFNDGTYIFVCNHKSVFDVIPVALSADKPVHFIAKKELFEKGISKWFTAKCQCIPVSRDGNDVRAIMQAMRYLKNGENIAIFPEGTRNKGEDVFLPFKGGAAALSIKTKTPIVPMVMVKKIKFFKTTHVYLGEPIVFPDGEDVNACEEILRNRMLEMYNELSEKLEKKKK